MASFARVGDRQEDLVLKELLRTGIHEGDSGKAINDFYTSAGLAPLPASKAVSGKPPKQASPKSVFASLDPASERDGKLCVAALANRAQRPDRVARLGVLDGEGAYAVAVSCGLFRALTCAMCDAALEVQSRWIEGRCFSYLHHFTTTLFRGERHRTDGGFLEDIRFPHRPVLFSECQIRHGGVVPLSLWRPVWGSRIRTLQLFPR